MASKDPTSPMSPVSPYPPIRSPEYRSRAPEFYGFVAWTSTSLGFVLYLLWALLPDHYIIWLGVHWYPNRCGISLTPSAYSQLKPPITRQRVGYPRSSLDSHACHYNLHHLLFHGDCCHAFVLRDEDHHWYDTERCFDVALAPLPEI